MVKEVKVGDIVFSNDKPFVLIAGPCQMESLSHAVEMADALQQITNKLNIPFVFKASFDKANRTSLSGIRGIGMEAGLHAFEEVKRRFGCLTLTDIHEVYQCSPVGDVVDILQIPAFLCRQTDLLVAAAKTGKTINVKKGQFLAPWDMKNVVGKLVETGNENVLLTERGTCFGYNTLVVDVRSIPIMKQTGYPVIIDATHAVQQPGGNGTSSGGNREYAPLIAGACVSGGVAGVFVETHKEPDKAPSDGANMIVLNELEKILIRLKEFDQIAKKSY